MPHLDSTLDLLRHHHHANGSAGRRGGAPSSTSWHALRLELEDIREATASGDLQKSFALLVPITRDGPEPPGSRPT